MESLKKAIYFSSPMKLCWIESLGKPQVLYYRKKTWLSTIRFNDSNTDLSYTFNLSQI